MKPLFQIPASCTRMSLRGDGSFNLGFVTELEIRDVNERAKLLDWHNKTGWLTFKENEITPEDIPDEDAATDESKSPSQRLRAVLYVWWKRNGVEGDRVVVPDFEEFYRHHMERIINKYKTFLD